MWSWLRSTTRCLRLAGSWRAFAIGKRARDARRGEADHEGVVAARDGAGEHVAEDALVRVLEAGVAQRRGEDEGPGLREGRARRDYAAEAPSASAK